IFVISETKKRDALAGSTFNADGTITIVVPKSAFSNAQPGDLLGAMGGRTLTGDTQQTDKLERSNAFIDHTLVKAQGDSAYPAATTTAQFSASVYQANDGSGQVTITGSRTGPTDGTTSVRYVAGDGTANQRDDFTYTTGRLSFAPGDTQAQLEVLVNERSDAG